MNINISKKQSKIISITFVIIGAILLLSGLEEVYEEGYLIEGAIPLVSGVLSFGLGLFIWHGDNSKSESEIKSETQNKADIENIKNKTIEETLLSIEQQLTRKILEQHQSHFSKNEVFQLIKNTLKFK